MKSARPRAPCPAKRVQRFERIANADQPLLVAGRKVSIDDRECRALLQRRGDEGMPIAVRTSDGDEALALGEATGIDREAGDGRSYRAERRATSGVNDLA